MDNNSVKTKRPRDWDADDGPALSSHQSTIHSFFTKAATGLRPISASASLMRRRPGNGKTSSSSKERKTRSPSNAPFLQEKDRKACNNTPSTETPQSKECQVPIVSANRKHTAEVNEENETVAADAPEETLARNNHKTKKQRMQQLYLDLGQHNFGKQTVCQTCGMLYVHGVDEDAKEHEKICKDFRDGVSFQMKLKACRVVAQYDKDDACILEVRPCDSYSLRQKVNQVMVIVDKELGFVEEEYPGTSDDNDGKKSPAPKTVYLYILKKRVMGMASVEILKEAYCLQSGRDGQQQQRSRLSSRAMIGIHKLWVHSKVRKQNIATRLVDTTRRRMVFGTVVPPKLVAFSSPTEAGTRFARGYLRRHCASKDTEVPLLVYDLPTARH